MSSPSTKVLTSEGSAEGSPGSADGSADGSAETSEKVGSVWSLELKPELINFLLSLG